jgi:hypothetical protein
LELRRVWRLCKRQYAAQAFSGLGAKLYGGRWNEVGLAMVYTADSLSLAALETFVHLDPELLPSDYVAIAADLPGQLRLTRIQIGDLPADWRRYPAPDVLRRIGSDWQAKPLYSPFLQLSSRKKKITCSTLNIEISIGSCGMWRCPFNSIRECGNRVGGR